MLKQVTLENIAIVDSLSVSFGHGLTVMTGETGAGKSILMESIGLALGAKASAKDILKAGQERGRIEIVLDWQGLPQQEAVSELLKVSDIDLPEEETDLILSREVTVSATRFRLNGIPVTREFVENLRPYLVDFHAQHEIAGLLNKSQQRRMLDQLGGAALLAVKKQVAEAYSLWSASKQQLEAHLQSQREMAQRQEFVSFQLAEIQEAQLQDPEEDESLRQERERLMHGERLNKLSQQIVAGLGGAGQWEDSVSLPDLLHKLQKPMNEAAKVDDSLEPLLERWGEVQAWVAELSDAWQTYQDRLQLDPESLHAVVDRLDVLEKLKRKYGPHLVQVIETEAKLTEELSRYENHEAHLQALQKTVSETQSRLSDCCVQLSQLRQGVAAQVREQLQPILIELALPKAQVDVVLTPVSAMTSDGAEEVEIYFSANPGEPMLPLSKVASGGELSRVLLALKVVGADAQGVPVMVFDEIDTGMSGVAAKSVGEKLLMLSQSAQILVITHQPIIAALGDHHWHVEKQVEPTLDGERVQVIVNNVTQKEKRLQVMSRLASGIDTDDEAVEKYIQRLLSEAQLVREKHFVKKQ
jgi:DNA repair protein RecN (Recombination protein N)